MKTISQNELLDAQIKLLKIKQSDDFEMLKNQFDTTLESLKPINIVKATIADFKQSKEVKNSLFESALGIASGFLTRKLLVNKSSGIVKKITASIIQYMVTQFVTKKAEKINEEEKEEEKSL